MIEPLPHRQMVVSLPWRRLSERVVRVGHQVSAGHAVELEEPIGDRLCDLTKVCGAGFMHWCVRGSVERLFRRKGSRRNFQILVKAIPMELAK